MRWAPNRDRITNLPRETGCHGARLAIFFTLLPSHARVSPCLQKLSVAGPESSQVRMRQTQLHYLILSIAMRYGFFPQSQDMA